jgi:hypothetical protein
LLIGGVTFCHDYRRQLWETTIKKNYFYLLSLLCFSSPSIRTGFLLFHCPLFLCVYFFHLHTYNFFYNLTKKLKILKWLNSPLVFSLNN